MNTRTRYISFRVNNIEKKAISMAAKDCGLSTSEFARRASLNMKVTLRFSPEELEVYNNLHIFTGILQSSGTLLKVIISGRMIPFSLNWKK